MENEKKIILAGADTEASFLESDDRAQDTIALVQDASAEEESSSSINY